MWGYVVDKLRSRRDPNEQNCLAAVKQKWDAISNQVHEKMLNYIHKNMRECIATHSGNASY